MIILHEAGLTVDENVSSKSTLRVSHSRRSFVPGGLNLRDKFQRRVRMLKGEGALKYQSTRWGPTPRIYVVRLGFGELMR